MTREYFGVEMRRMAGLKFPPAGLETHWEGLRDLPEPVLRAAVTRAIKTRVDFPTPAELREDADIAAPASVAPAVDRSVPLETPVTWLIPQTRQAITATREWVYDCDVCRDSGWADRSEPGKQPSVARCACYAINPTLVRRREALARYAEAGGQRRAR